MEATAFVEDWLCYDSILGEGAYGEVRLLVHRKTEEKIACKIIDHSRYRDAKTNINREVTLHSMLNHENIIRYFGRRQEPHREYIFLEYASGGELFQLIEPDVGMPSGMAQKFMKHLLNGLSYLHQKGIAHRDIKPENLLIDGNGTLKISDFGLATIFRLKGKERKLDKRCGTKPYLAPEILKSSYFARPADIWSCGIVFVAMLTGELPWTDTSDDNEEFSKWRKNVYISETPWSKLGNTALSLARQILNEVPEKRLTLEQIVKHTWMKFSFGDVIETDQPDGFNSSEAKRCNSMFEAETRNKSETPQVTLSQPVFTFRPTSLNQLITDLKALHSKSSVCFSQPVKNEDVILQFTQSPVTQDNFHNLVKRMTRFYVDCDLEAALETLCSTLDSLHYSWTIDVKGMVTVSTVDSVKNQLIFKVNLLNMDGKILIDFRLSKGCGLEFKKRFLKLKSSLGDIVAKT
ncbi:serine/threonine-protein kinase grp [Cylas formicarius]|uniref:serine/threonine-protein kinase grp n=1 Tax=Cylas formicarius TaxID=197179 RepID=UPI0029583620|nr:serine/threonine-protein kinase grp [Cylas formicarius]